MLELWIKKIKYPKIASKSGENIENIQNRQRRASYTKNGFPSIKNEVKKEKTLGDAKRAAMVRALVSPMPFLVLKV